MKTQPSFEQQYQKIVQAYYRNELKPFSGCACFVGNLLNNKDGWEEVRIARALVAKLPPVLNENGWSYSEGVECIQKESKGLYTPLEIATLEHVFIMRYVNEGGKMDTYEPLHEDALFQAMSAALQHLKDLHISKGETVSDYNFQKRTLHENI